MADTIYSVTVQFAGERSRLIERKQFLFTSKDTEVDFVANVGKRPGESVISRAELKAYGRGQFIVALNDLERAKLLPVNS